MSCHAEKVSRTKYLTPSHTFVVVCDVPANVSEVLNTIHFKESVCNNLREYALSLIHILYCSLV